MRPSLTTTRGKRWLRDSHPHLHRGEMQNTQARAAPREVRERIERAASRTFRLSQTRAIADGEAIGRVKFEMTEVSSCHFVYLNLAEHTGCTAYVATGRTSPG